ncbi:MAG: peptidylprolyl isomerase [Chloracidobacterium sp.]|nr:peptidylprolyl isomerase [Chloracidobacterium sp.]
MRRRKKQPTRNPAASRDQERRRSDRRCRDRRHSKWKTAAYGTIKIELYSNIAPKMVARFKELAKEGVYDGVTWHRINDLVIQSGDPLSKTTTPRMTAPASRTSPTSRPNSPTSRTLPASSVRPAVRTTTRRIRSSFSRSNVRPALITATPSLAKSSRG